MFRGSFKLNFKLLTLSFAPFGHSGCVTNTTNQKHFIWLSFCHQCFRHIAFFACFSIFCENISALKLPLFFHQRISEALFISEIWTGQKIRYVSCFFGFFLRTKMKKWVVLSSAELWYFIYKILTPGFSVTRWGGVGLGSEFCFVLFTTTGYDPKTLLEIV